MKNFFLKILIVAFSSAVMAGEGDFVPYKIKMERKAPDEPLRKSTIMGQVKDQFAGRILSIEPQRHRGQDCHVVKLMGDDGEFRIIHVACEE